MNILITGGTGFIGSSLISRFIDENHTVTVLTRNTKYRRQGMNVITNLNQVSDESFDVVINLAGEPIANRRWSDKQKQKITKSRIEITQALIEYFKKSNMKPGLFISASAVGYYGVGQSNDIVTESSDGDDSFSSVLCKQWEDCTEQATTLGIRTCILRIGIVLGKDGGALSKMLLPFKLGLGGKIGSGNQWMPWIHIDDIVNIVQTCINDKSISGVVNATAPNPVTNRDFTVALGRALNRPTLFSIPAFVIRLILGQMGEELLLSGKKVMPGQLQQSGFNFSYNKIGDALNNII